MLAHHRRGLHSISSYLILGQDVFAKPLTNANAMMVSHIKYRLKMPDWYENENVRRPN